MKRLNNKGSTILTTPIIIAIGTMMVSVLIVVAVNIITPFLWYEKLSSTAIKYIFIMEEYGYLTGNEVKELKYELQSQGFDMEKMRIKYTNYQVEYGEPIYLSLSYDYELSLPLMETTNIPMKIERKSVSKR